MARKHLKPIIALPATGETTIRPEVAEIVDAAGTWDAKKLLDLVDGISVNGRDDAKVARNKEGMIVSSFQRSERSGETCSCRCAKLMSGKDPTKHQSNPIAAKDLSSERHSGRHSGDPIETVKDGEQRKLERLKVERPG